VAPEFIEPEPNNDIVPHPVPKVFTNEFISGVVKKSIQNGDIPSDHKLAFVGAVDERGARAIISVQILDKEVLVDNKLNIKLQSILEHEWTGDNKAGAQVLFSVK
jgi:hypothetical protein